ncbi:MAG: hypothetical protein OJF49_002054 [Ktedonobacterales bacterium]|jgi:WD40 repeat protein|nr:MAG: hypothetical protein OJF49_002054 [Ktedonobacterales bacterium]
MENYENQHTAEDVEVEVSDLRHPDTPVAAPRWSPSGFLGSALSPRQRLARAAGIVCTLLLAALVITLTLRAALGASSTHVSAPWWIRVPTDSPSLAGGTGATPNLGGMACLRDAAWSPDSQFFAFAGTSESGCPFDHYAPNLVNIYRSGSGNVIRQIHPDSAIFAALHIPVPSPVTPPSQPGTPFPTGVALWYNALLWSPDGQQIAVTFALSLNRDSAPAATGVALLNLGDGSTRVLVAPTSPTMFTGAYNTWDLLTGTVTVGPRSTATPPPFSNLPLAQSYTWDATGALVPGPQLPRAATAPPTVASGPVGNPAGDAIFTPWQPDVLQIADTTPDGKPLTTAIATFNAFFSAWSPDGRYLIDGLTLGGRLQLPSQPAPSHTDLLKLQLDTTPLLPLRDAGLQQALTNLIAPITTSPVHTQNSFAQLAWRPDGRVLAITDNQDNGYILYDCQTGRRLLTAPNTNTALLNSGGFAGPRWSPDGKWLILPPFGALVSIPPLAV